MRLFNDRIIASPDRRVGRQVLRTTWAMMRVNEAVKRPVDRLFGIDRVHNGAAYLVSERYRFVYFVIHKAGSSSLYQMLGAIPGAACAAVWHVRPADFAAFDERYRDFFKFAIVRNPYRRILSCHRDKIAAANTLRWLTTIARHPGLRPQMPLKEFCQWLSTPAGDDHNADPHWMSQHAQLFRNGRCRCDYVGKIEELPAVLVEIARRVDIESPPPLWLNRSGGSMRNSEPALDGEDKELLASRYAEDFRLFEYDPATVAP